MKVALVESVPFPPTEGLGNYVWNLGTWDRRAVLERIQSPIAQSVERALIRNARMVSAVSDSVAADLAVYGLDTANVRVLGNGIDPDVFHPGDKPREDFLLVTGRL